VDIEFLSQNWHLILTLVIILALLVLEPVLLKASGINQVSPLSVTQLVNRQSATILDVRSSKEYTAAHIPDAVNIPLSDFAAQADKLENYKGKPVIVSCRSGSRAKNAAKKLGKQGFKEIYILSGGNLAWEKENLPMTRNAS
jgi:rhodanese-related sulfurtransferase